MAQSVFFAADSALERCGLVPQILQIVQEVSGRKRTGAGLSVCTRSFSLLCHMIVLMPCVDAFFGPFPLCKIIRDDKDSRLAKNIIATIWIVSGENHHAGALREISVFVHASGA